MSFRSRVSKILAQIAFICHIFHVPIFHIYHLALKALRTRSYMACQARNISGRNPFSCKELRIGLLISGFSNPLQNAKANPSCFSRWAVWPLLPSRWCLLLCWGTAHWKQVFLCSILKLCYGERGRLLSTALAAEKRLGHSPSCWEAAPRPGHPFCSVPLSLLHQVVWCHNRIRMQLSQYLTPSQFLIFPITGKLHIRRTHGSVVFVSSDHW